MPAPNDSKADSTLARPLAHLVGRVIAGRYRFDHLLGRGGVGAVYLAEDLQAGETVAVKALLPGLANAAEVAARLAREARAARRIEHPNVVEIRELVADGDDLYLVMELLAGSSLAEVLELGALPPRRALVIARQVLEALGHAHAGGVIHRDLKPSNIMLVKVGEPGREYERIKLLDFGLVKLVGDAAAELGDDQLTQGGMVFGTPAYIAPEQALGQQVDRRADLYALGVVAFEMLTGRTPYRSPDPVTLTRMHAAAPVPTLASVSPRPWTPELEALIARALAKRTTDRFSDAAEMTAALDVAFLSLDRPAG